MQSREPILSESARPSTRVIAAFACVYLFWGSTYVAIRFGVQVLPPFVLASARFLIAGPLMLGLCAGRGMRLRQTGRDLAMLAAIGVLMLGVGNMGLVWCEQYLPSGLAALLLAVIPIYIALFEAVLPNGEGLRAKGWAGIGIGLLGMIVLFSPALGWFSPAGGAARHGRNEQLMGSLVAMLAALAWSCGSILSRHAKVATSAFVAAAWEMMFAGIFNFGVMTLSGGSFRMHWRAQAVWSVAWLVTFGSLVGYTAYIYLLDHVPVAKVSTYAYVNPVIAVVLGAVLLKERMAGIEYVGMAAILAAVYLVTSSKLKAPKRAPDEELDSLA